MFTFSRSRIRQFRAVLRRAGISKQPGGFNQKLVLVSLGDRYALQAMSGIAAIELSVLAPCDLDRIVLPLDVLAVCESRSDDPITIQRTSDNRVTVEWTDGQIPQCRQFDVELPEDLPSFPALPQQFGRNESNVWQALHDAVESADHSRSRYALDCLQLRGEAGQIVATDGRQVLVQSGITLPWTEDVLIPALPVLGCRELPQDDPVTIGRSGDWVMLLVGGWTVAVQIEKEARFPKVDSIIPAKNFANSRLCLTDQDAQFLASSLPKLPCPQELEWPVTVELNGHVVVRGRGTDDSRPTELLLSQSRLEGRPVTCQTNREHLARALRLGFREILLTEPTAPALCDDGSRQFVWAMLNAESVVPAQPDAVRIESPAAGAVTSVSHRKPHRPPTPMPRPRPERISSPQPACSPDEARTEARTMTALIEEAEALKTTLRDALGKTSVLVAGLKRQRKQTQLLRATLQSLQQLQAIEA